MAQCVSLRSTYCALRAKSRPAAQGSIIVPQILSVQIRACPLLMTGRLTRFRYRVAAGQICRSKSRDTERVLQLKCRTVRCRWIPQDSSEGEGSQLNHESTLKARDFNIKPNVQTVGMNNMK